MAFCKHRVMDSCKKDNRPCIFSEECFEPEEKKVTNADRIRSMTDEELAKFLCEFDPCHLCEHKYQKCSFKDCEEIRITKEWLKSEVGCE